MSRKDLIDTGGYASGEILASDSDLSEIDNDPANFADSPPRDSETAELLSEAEEVLRALKRPSSTESSRKRVLPLSSEPSDSEHETETPSSALIKSSAASCSKTTPRNTSKAKKGTMTPQSTISKLSKRPSFDKTPSRKAPYIERSSHSTHSPKRKTPPSNNDRSDGIMGMLSEISNKLCQVVNRMDQQETRLESIEKQVKRHASSSSGSSSTEYSAKKIPPIIRSEVRSMYRTLIEEDENFQGYNTDLGTSFKDDENVKITDRLAREVKSANASFQMGSIRAAAYTYYRSLCQEQSLQRRGMKGTRDQKRRRRERINRKLHNRVSMLSKSDLPDKDKSMWMSVLVPGFISSDYSCSDSEDDALVTQPLEWRSKKVTEFFYKLDVFIEEEKSPQARKQTKERVLAEHSSSRSTPNGKFPSWALGGSH